MKDTPTLEQDRRRQTAPSAKPKAVNQTLSPKARQCGPVALLEEQGPNPQARAVVIEFFGPTASQVFVAGTFNDWRPRATPMTKQAGGRWSTELTLKPGSYEYRLIVDGQWQDDPMAVRFTAIPCAGLNCVLEVGLVES
jgi:1,4-alpha-glucan branching enzyme